MSVSATRWLILTLLLVFCRIAHAQKVNNEEYSVTLPTSLIKEADTTAADAGDLYYDQSFAVILMISERHSRFKSVKDYMDCSNRQLEDQLKNFYSDTSLQLLSCSRSPYYPKETVALNFSVSVLPYGFNTCLVYFIHHKDSDLQFSFTYNKEQAKKSMKYIDDIMQTLVLK